MTDLTFIHQDLIDRYLQVSNQEAIEMARRLTKSVLFKSTQPDEKVGQILLG
jgi:hypothetical protein